MSMSPTLKPIQSPAQGADPARHRSRSGAYPSAELASAAAPASSEAAATAAAATPAYQGLSVQVVYDAYRRQIEHEDNLIGQRTSWLLMGESFLVVGYCILHQLAPPDPHVQPVTQLLSGLVAWLGFSVAVLGLAGVVAAARVMGTLRADFQRHAARWPVLAEYLRVVPMLQPTGRALFLGRIPALGLPLALGAFWLTMIVASAAAGWWS